MIRHFILCCMAILVMAGCSPTTQLIGSMKPEGVTAKKYEKLCVVVLSPQMSNRAMLETAVADKLKAKGINGRVTYDIFPFAGQLNELKLTPQELQEKVKQKVAANNIDGLLIISLLDKQNEQHYVEGSSFSFSAPVYQYPYYGYYSYAYTTVYSNGYYVNSSKYFLECNFYDIATEKLAWIGQTKTTDPASVEKEAPAFADIVVSNMLSKGVIIP